MRASQYNRDKILEQEVPNWIAQQRPDITLDNQKGYTFSVYDLTLRLSWYVRQNNKGKLQDVVKLFQKAQVLQGKPILTDMDGKRWHKVPRKGWEVMVPKRKLSQASILKNRYRRGLITIPKQIAKIEAQVEEYRIEGPIVETEQQRVRNAIDHLTKNFEATYRLKPYPYHQSVTGFAGKVPSKTFFELRGQFLTIRNLCARLEDLDRRISKIHRELRYANSHIAERRKEMAKLGHGADPRKKLAWEK